MNNTSTAMCMFENRPTNTSSGINMFVNYSAAGQVQYRDSSGAPISSSITVSANTWNHYALVRSGSTITLWINGQSGGSVTKTTNFTDNTCVLAQDQGGGFNFAGYLSNFRIVKGTALYTANFTPATSTLTSVAGTSLLTCHANRLADGSANNFAITKNGDVSVRSFNPFNLTNTGTTGSVYFDGTGDYLTILGNSSSFNLGTSNFTLEAWFYIPNLSGRKYIFGPGTDTASHYDGIGLEIWDNKVAAWASSNGTSWDIYECDTAGNRGSGTVIANMWNHIAYVRNVNNFAVYLNGVQQISFTSSAAIAYQTSNPYNIGRSAYSPDNFPFNGYISNLRLVKGTAIYTSNNFTLAGEPLTAIANTQLLTLQNRQPHNNHTFQDASSNNFLITRSGNATQGTFSPFSQTGWGNYFNGSSYLSIASNAAFDFGSGNFTLEAWVNLSSTSSNFQIYASTTGGYSSPQFIWVYNSAIGLRFYAHSGSYDFSQGSISGWSAGTWYHVALVRNGTTVTLYKDGVSVASGSVSTASFGNSTSTQAIAASVSESTYATGYISNLRAVKGVAVYTGAFTPPTSPLTATQSAGTNIAAITGTETSLLTCQSNRFVDNSSTPKTITVNGSPSVQAFSPFNPTASWSAQTNGGSGYFDGSGDFLTAATNSAVLDSGSGTITVEAWVYLTENVSSGAFGLLVGPRGASGTSGLAFGFGNSGGATRLGVSYIAVGYIGSTLAVPLNAWTHVAYVLTNATTCKTYLNGVLDATFSLGGTQNVQGLCVAAGDTGASPIVGYISNLRVVKNVTVYTSNFTPPTTPVTNITNTQLLLNFTNAGIYDATSRNVLETVGDAKISTAQSRWGGSSMAFDGTGDRINIPLSPFHSFGSADFTIEGWVYLNSIPGFGTLVATRTSGGDGTSGRFSLAFRGSALEFFSGVSTIIVGGSVSTGAFIHFVASRSSGSLRLFLNGTQVGSTTSFTTSLVAGALTIGDNQAGNEPLNGYLQDVRITIGYARYTANFTPPTAAFLTL